MKRLFLMFAMTAALGFAACGDEEIPVPTETDAQADASAVEDTGPPESDGTAPNDGGPSTPGLPDISVPSTDTGGPSVPDGSTGSSLGAYNGAPCGSSNDCVQNPEHVCFMGYCAERCKEDGVRIDGACDMVSTQSIMGDTFACSDNLSVCTPGKVEGAAVVCSDPITCNYFPDPMVCAGAVLIASKTVDGVCIPPFDRLPVGSDCFDHMECQSLRCMGGDAQGLTAGSCVDHCTLNKHCLDGHLCIGVGFTTTTGDPQPSAWAGMCRDVGAGDDPKYCSAQDKCPEGTYCETFIEPTSLGGQTWCVATNEGGVGVGETCEEGGDCAGGSCYFGPNIQEGTEGYCSWSCPGGLEDCGDGMACILRALHNNGSIDDLTDDKMTGECVYAGFGDPCVIDEEWCEGENAICAPVDDEEWSENFGICAEGEPPPDPCETLECDDELDCTADSCADGACSNVLSAESNSCLIEDACHADGDADPTNPCATCQPLLLDSSWIAVADGLSCGDDGETCLAGVCEVPGDPCDVLNCPDGESCVVSDDGVPSCIADAPADPVCDPACADGETCTAAADGTASCVADAPADPVCDPACADGETCTAAADGTASCVADAPAEPVCDPACADGETCTAAADGTASCVADAPAEPVCDPACADGETCTAAADGTASCVADTPVDPCDALTCADGESCVVAADGTASCVADTPADPCDALTCADGESCVVAADGTASCVADTPADPCDALTCPENESCVVAADGTASCVADTPVDPCDALTCPEGESCVVADDDTASCVADTPADPCDALTCPEGESCVVEADGTASCAAETPVDPCAALTCGDDESCVVADDGTASCVLTCDAGLTDCGGACVDITSDANNCGSCAAVCGGGETCTDSACVATLCAEDQHVVSNECVACPAGSTNAVGDNATGLNTVCDATLCAEDQYVVSNACVACAAGTTNAGGDNATGADTACDAPTVHVVVTSGFSFSPDDLTINAGESVEFQLSGSHNAVEVSQDTWQANGNTPLADGFEVGFGDTEQVQFDTPGTYYYVCAPHAGGGMKGKITVQ